MVGRSNSGPTATCGSVDRIMTVTFLNRQFLTSAPETAKMASLFPSLGRAAIRVPSANFVCRQCAHQRPRVAALVRARGYAAMPSKPMPAASMPPKGELSQEFFKASQSSSRDRSSSSSSFPEVSSKAVAYWLLGSAASVFGIVVFGGLTRLTESGYARSLLSSLLNCILTCILFRLSITEWKPVTGSLPPLSQADWESEFEKYRASPEYKLLNPHMELVDFKKIYYMEWTHRVWGRVVGLSFVLPTIYFIARRRVSPRMALNLVGISGLIGFQGIIGWWMVKSGLKDDLFAPGSHPRVSQYRLSAHLGTAFICYTWMVASALSILRTRRLVADPAAAMKAISALQNPVLSRFRTLAMSLGGLTFVTAMSGALVAGLDAGLIYNEFPFMGNGLTPPTSELFDEFYSRKEDHSDLWWRNMLENPSTVQLNHRIMATATFTSVIALFAYSRSGRLAAVLPPSVKKAMTGCVHLALMQVTLGICTLLWLVPVPLAAAHQAGALALLTGVLTLGHRMRVPPSTLRMIQKRLQQAPKQ